MSALLASTLASEADQRLFKAVIQIPNHVLRKLLPEVRKTNYDLRSRAHKFKLPSPINDERNFIYPTSSLQRYVLRLTRQSGEQFLLALNNMIDLFFVILVASPASYEFLLLNDY